MTEKDRERMRVFVGRIGVALMAALLMPIAVLAQEAPAGGARQVTLGQALDLALRNNRDLRDAMLERQRADDQVREAWGSVFPTLDLTASYARNLALPVNFVPATFFDPDADPDELVPLKFGADNNWDLQLRAEQPIFEAAAFVGVGAAERFRTLQSEVVRGNAIDVSTRVKVAYYDALLAEESVRLNENTVQRIEQTLEETQAMNRAGMASNYDVLRLEVELANVRPELRRSRNAAAEARRALAIELGASDLDSVDVVGSLADVAFDDLAGIDSAAAVAAEEAPAVEPGIAAAALVIGSSTAESLTPQQAIEMAFSHRSDVRQLELTRQLRETELKVERAGYLPTISVFGSYSVNAQQNGAPDFFGSSLQRSTSRQVGVQVTIPLFSGFQRPARTGQLRTGIDQVRTQQTLLVDQVENEVKTLLEQVDEAKDRGAAQRLALRQAERGYEIASVQYREGISSPLEVTDAEVALRESEFNYAEAVYDYLVARAQLEQALGLEPPIEAMRGIAQG